jgi:transcriptional regulator with XRE-family HTH domain
MTIESAQVRAGRALVGWSQAELANAAGLSLATVELFEMDGANQVSAEAVAKMRAALESAGVVFIADDGDGAGVRLHKVRESKYLGWEDLNASNDE